MDSKLKKYSLRYMRVWGYIGIAIVIVAAFFLLGRVGHAISVFLAGALMAFIYAPIVNYLDRRFGVPRLLGTLVGLFTMFAAVFLLFAALLPPLMDQLLSLIDAAPDYIAGVSALWNELVTYFDQLDPAIKTQVDSTLADLSKRIEEVGAAAVSVVGKGLFQGVVGTASAVVTFFMTTVLSFWLAKDFPRIEREIAMVVGPKIGEDYRIVTSVFGRSMGGYLKGLLITSTCTGTLAGVGYWILGIPYSGLLGLITGVLNIIPYVGPWIGGFLAFFVGLTVGWLPALLSILVTVSAQEATNTFISPKVMQTAVALHPALVIVALIAGGAAAGVFGMVAAVPLTAAAKGVFVYYFEKKTGRQLVSKDGALFRGERFTDAEGNPRPACDALGVDIEGDKGVPPRIKEEMERMRASAQASEADAAASGSDAANGAHRG